MTTVALVDYGGCNLASLRFAFERLGAEVMISANAEQLQSAERLVLPGVGHATTAMQTLSKSNIVDFIRLTKKPVLGICLGMQVMFDWLEEGQCNGLGLIHGKVQRLQGDAAHRTPHMGWNQIHRKRKHPVMDALSSADDVYFVHGYAAPIDHATLGVCSSFGGFSAAAGNRNFLGMQFHPEKSAISGARCLQAFLQWTP